MGCYPPLGKMVAKAFDKCRGILLPYLDQRFVFFFESFTCFVDREEEAWYSCRRGILAAAVVLLCAIGRQACNFQHGPRRRHAAGHHPNGASRLEAPPGACDLAVASSGDGAIERAMPGSIRAGIDSAR